MKNYFKLLDLLFSVSDCVAFEVEAYENIYFKITEEEIINLFNEIRCKIFYNKIKHFF